MLSKRVKQSYSYICYTDKHRKKNEKNLQLRSQKMMPKWTLVQGRFPQYIWQNKLKQEMTGNCGERKTAEELSHPITRQVSFYLWLSFLSKSYSEKGYSSLTTVESAYLHHGCNSSFTLFESDMDINLKWCEITVISHTIE